jgi:hypothetical protein
MKSLPADPADPAPVPELIAATEQGLPVQVDALAARPRLCRAADRRVRHWTRARTRLEHADAGRRIVKSIGRL